MLLNLLLPILYLLQNRIILPFYLLDIVDFEDFFLFAEGEALAWLVLGPEADGFVSELELVFG